jgi:site-specific DNA-methyltransferase (adenine-specific)
VDHQVGLEKTPQEYVDSLVKVFREVKRVLRQDGTLWLNLGDSYSRSGRKPKKAGVQAGTKGPSSVLNHFGEGFTSIATELPAKNLIGIPWQVAFALRADGWILRQDIIWSKNNPMPESCKDRCTTAHEHIFLLTRSPEYYFDYKAIQEPTSKKGGRPRKFGSNKQTGTFRHDIGRTFVDNGVRNKRSVWTVNVKGYKGAHFATFPKDLITPCILAGSKPGDIILDPFAGSGTVGEAAEEYSRRAMLIELNPKYVQLIQRRLGVRPMEKAA